MFKKVLMLLFVFMISVNSYAITIEQIVHGNVWHFSFCENGELRDFVVSESQMEVRSTLQEGTRGTMAIFMTPFLAVFESPTGLPYNMDKFETMLMRTEFNAKLKYCDKLTDGTKVALIRCYSSMEDLFKFYNRLLVDYIKYYNEHFGGVPDLKDWENFRDAMLYCSLLYVMTGHTNFSYKLFTCMKDKTLPKARAWVNYKLKYH